MLYGSVEQFLEGMGEGLAHHYACNRHHPEHFENGVRDMNLIDAVEMLADWKAASERHADGDILKSIALNAERFGYSEQLSDIMRNTVERYLKNKDTI